MNQPSSDRPYLITFTDLVYAALVSYSLPLVDRSVSSLDYTAGLLSFSVILLLYDWYGEHFVSAQRGTGTLSIVFDFVALIIYFLLLFFGARASHFWLAAFAARAARGLVMNNLLLRGSPSMEQKRKLQVWNYSSSWMFVSCLVLLVMSVVWWELAPLWLLTSGVLIWITGYLVAILMEWVRFKGRRGAADPND